MRTESELVDAIAKTRGEQAGALCFIEVVLHKDDCSKVVCTRCVRVVCMLHAVCGCRSPHLNQVFPPCVTAFHSQCHCLSLTVSHNVTLPVTQFHYLALIHAVCHAGAAGVGSPCGCRQLTPPNAGLSSTMLSSAVAETQHHARVSE